MSALQLQKMIEQERAEKDELKAMLSTVLSKLEMIEGKIDFKTEDQEQLLNIDNVCLLVGFAHNWIYEQIKKNNFPKPIKFNSASRWKKSEIMIWMESQKPYRVT